MALQNCAGRFVLDIKSGIVLILTDAAHLRHNFLNVFIRIDNPNIDSCYRRGSRDEQSWLK
jgi:hypothetical protein